MATNAEEEKKMLELLNEAMKEAKDKDLKEIQSILKSARYSKLNDALAVTSASSLFSRAVTNPVFHAVTLKAPTPFIQTLLELAKEHKQAKGTIWNFYIEKDQAALLGNASLLHHAINANAPNQLDIIRILATKPREVPIDLLDAEGNTALRLAVAKKNPELITLLIKAGANINEHNPRDQRKTFKHTFLQNAVLEGDLNMVMCLIQNGADVKDLNEPVFGVEKGINYLHLLARQGNHPLLEYLVSLNRKDIHFGASDKFGRTIFHHVVLGGRKELLEWMLDQEPLKPIINKRNHKGRVPLHTAAMRGQIDSVRTLIKTHPEQMFIQDYVQEKDRDKGKKVGFPSETPLALAYRRARRFPNDRHGDSLPTVRLLRDEMNRTMLKYLEKYREADKKESKDVAEFKREREFKDINEKSIFPHLEERYAALYQLLKNTKSLTDKQRIFSSASFLIQDFIQRQDLVSGLIIPALESDGSIKPYRVNVLHEEGGVFAVALEPLIPTLVSGKQVKNVKVVFYGPSDIDKALEQIDSPASEQHAGHVSKALFDLLSKMKANNPKEDIAVDLIGQGLGGMDAQNATLGLMQVLDTDIAPKPFLANLRVVLLNSPGTNPNVVAESNILARKLKSTHIIEHIEKHILQVEGNYISNYGKGQIIFGAESKSLDENNEIAVWDSIIRDEMQLSIGTLRDLIPTITEATRVLRNTQQKLREKNEEIEKRRKEDEEAKKSFAVVRLGRYLFLKPMKELNGEFNDLLRQQMKEQAILNKLNDTYKTMQTRLYANISRCFNFQPMFDGTHEYLAQDQAPPGIDPKELELALPEKLRRIEGHSIRMEIFRGSHAAPKLTFISDFRRKLTEESEQLKVPLKADLKELEAGLVKKLLEEDKHFKELYDIASAYKRKEGPDFEKIYAAGEYLFHDVAYKNFEEGDYVPVLEDDGVSIRPYRVYPIYGHRGLVSFILTPVFGKGDIKTLCRGTHELNSAIRDLDKGAAGYNTFKARMPGILSVANEVIKAEKKRLREQGCSEELTWSIGGHSLGGADAAYFYVLMLSAVAQNTLDQLMNIGKGKEGKERKENKEIRDVKEIQELKQLLQEIDAIAPEIRNHIDGVKFRLQAYNAPGIDKRTAQEGLLLAQFLKRKDLNLPISLEAFYQRVRGDYVQQAGVTHLFVKDCPKEAVDLDILKFTDYAAFLGLSWSPIQAHTNKQLNGSLGSSRTIPLSPECIQRLHNVPSGEKPTHESEFTYLEGEGFLDEVRKSLKESLQGVASSYQAGERGPGIRPKA